MSSAHPISPTTHDAHREGAVHAHIVPPKVLLGVYAGLLVLTIATVAVTGIQFGVFNIWVALGIAVVKAALVVMYFMHLRYDAPFNGMILVIALLFVATFIGIAMLDTSEYKVNYDPPGTRQMVTSQNGL